MAAPLTRMRPSLGFCADSTALGPLPWLLVFTSQGDSHREAPLNENTVFKVECGCCSRHISLSASEQVGRSPMEECGRGLYGSSPRRNSVTRNERREEADDRNVSVGLLQLPGEGHKC